MSAAQLLRCATSEAAAACALEATTGMLTDGYAADLLVVPGNPLRPAHPQVHIVPAAYVRTSTRRASHPPPTLSNSASIFAEEHGCRQVLSCFCSTSLTKDVFPVAG
uniref:Amidohydrolase-related domain-containing protein n=1 Tax=Chrysotila carterae TaxID=13221 RepID=A0A7S4AZ19_CHRCT